MASGRLIDYLGHGDAADRPATPDLHIGIFGLWWSDDTSELSLWDGAAWVEDVGGGGGGSGTVTSVGTGTGLTGGPVTTTGTISLANTAVTPGSYTAANITVDAQGRVTAATNGSASTAWGSITGTLSSQTDLAAALAAKASNSYTIVTEASAFTATRATHAGADRYTRAGGDVTFNSAQSYQAGDAFKIRATGSINIVGTGVTLTPESGGTHSMTAAMSIEVIFTSSTAADIVGHTVPA